jgi:hypothetical protein
MAFSLSAMGNGPGLTPNAHKVGTTRCIIAPLLRCASLEAE